MKWAMGVLRVSLFLPVISSMALGALDQSAGGQGGRIEEQGGNTTADLAGITKVREAQLHPHIYTFPEFVDQDTRPITQILMSETRYNRAHTLMMAMMEEYTRKGYPLQNGITFMSLRVENIDRWAYEATHSHNYGQVVTIAVGEADSRFARVPLPPNVPLFELDISATSLETRHENIQANRHIPGINDLAMRRRPLQADIKSDSWGEKLIAAGFDPSKKTVWICEGILYYLNEGELGRLFQKMADLAPNGSRVIGDYLTHSLIQKYGHNESAVSKSGVVFPFN